MQNTHPDSSPDIPTQRPGLRLAVRIVRWLFLGAIALVSVAALWVTWQNWRGKAEWEACKEEMKARNEPLDLAVVMGNPPPDDQNFAMIPLLVEAANAAQKQTPLALFSWRDHAETNLGAWRQGQFADLAAYQKALRSLTNNLTPELQALHARPPGTPGADFLFLLSRNEAELRQVRQGLELPEVDFNYRQGLPSGTLMPKIVVLKQLTGAYRIGALAHLAENQPSAALDLIRDALRLSDTLKKQPVLITELVRLAMLDHVLQPVWEGLARHQWNDDQLKQLGRWLEQVNCVEDAARAYRGERALSLTLLNAVPAPQTVAPAPGVNTDPPPLPRFWPWRYQNLTGIARMFQDQILVVYSPTNRTVDLQKKKEMDRANDAVIKSWAPSSVFARMLYPALANAAYRVASTQASFHLATIAVALERHLLAKGTYPERLEELVPTYLPSVPVDPLTAKPPTYQRIGTKRFELSATTESKPESQYNSKKPKENSIRWVYPEPAK